MNVLLIFVFLFKLLSIFSIEAESTSDQMFELFHLRNTSKYGGICDMSINDEYVLPILRATTIEDMKIGQDDLNEFLSQNPEMESKICYGVRNDGNVEHEIHMSCQICEDSRNIGKKTHCCRCYNEEPQVYERQLGQPNPCKIKDSLFGDPCNYEVMQEVNEGLYNPFFQTIALARNPEEYIMALKTFATTFYTFYETPGNSRLTCYSSFNNLECKPSKTCGCRQIPPYFDYVLHPEGKRCIAKKGSVCHIEASFYDGFLEFLAKCSNGTECDDAIPDLTCDPILDKNCYLTMQRMKHEEEDHDRISYQLLKWNIRACGGFWNKSGRTNSGSRIYNTTMSVELIFVALLLLGTFAK